MSRHFKASGLSATADSETKSAANCAGSTPAVTAARPSIKNHPPGIQANGQIIAFAKAMGVRCLLWLLAIRN